MKQRKQKRLRKKKKSGWFLLWRLLLCIPVVTVLINLYALHECVWHSYRQLWNYKAEYISNGIKRREKKGISVSDYLSQMLCYRYGRYDEAMWVMLQPETGEFFMNEPYAKAIVWQNGESKIYRLHDCELIDRLDSTFNQLSYDHSTIVYSIYVRDDQFIPGEVYMQKQTVLTDTSLWKEGTPRPGEWVDLSPENTEGWTKVCTAQSKEQLASDQNFNDNYADDTSAEVLYTKDMSFDGKQYLSWVSINGSPNSPHIDKLKKDILTTLNSPGYKDMIAENQEAVETAKTRPLSLELLYSKGTGQTISHEQYVEQFRKKNYDKNLQILTDAYSFSDWEQIDAWYYGLPIYGLIPYETDPHDYKYWDITYHDQDWILFTVHFTNEWEKFLCLFQRALVWTGGIVRFPIIGFFIALVWAVICYLIYSKRYDIEAYRRNLTNALAHDLKTPLAVIYGHAENLNAHTHPEKADEYTACIMENVEHIDGMIAGVLGLAQLESRAAPKRKDKVDLTALLHDAFLRNTSLMEQRGLTLQESGTLKIKGNAEMLRQLAENLAANAVQHSAEGGTITVTAVKRKLCISNPYTGKLDAKTLCEPFKRGDKARGSQSGSGLGLSIVQQIAALNRMKLRITAKNGVFTLTLKSRKRPVR